MLEVTNLDCVRGDRKLFSNINLSLKPGTFLQLQGANGSGKTSLLRILCGLLAPSRGEVRWNGTRIQRLAEEYTRCLVYIGHASALKDDLSPLENLDFASRLAGAPVHRDALRWALSTLAVPDLPVRQLSQ